MDERGPFDDDTTTTAEPISTSARLFQSAMADEPTAQHDDPTRTIGIEDFVRHLDQQERMRGPRARIRPTVPKGRPEVPDLDFSSLTKPTRDAIGEKIDL